MAEFKSFRSGMKAADRDPWISVSLLSESVFCPRAGVLTFEAQSEDTGEEVFQARRGQFRKFYTINSILRELRFQSMVALLISVICLGFWLGNPPIDSHWALGPPFDHMIAKIILSPLFAMIVLAFVVWKSLVRFSITPAVVSMGLLGLILVTLFGNSRDYYLVIPFVQWLHVLIISLIYVNTLNSLRLVPDPNHSESMKISWWGLIRGGFEPITLREGLRDPEWRIVGRPWKILRKGDLRIPVFRKRMGWNSANPERLYRQHYARMAAYCHLLEKCEGASSPYGIVMFGDSSEGVTVPCHPGTRKTFHDSLRDARSLLGRVSAGGPDPLAPGNSGRCRKCPLGRPDWSTGQSECGSRFQWVPPYQVDQDD